MTDQSKDRPSEPNTGFVRYEPGAYHPRLRHDFAQVWYFREGTFKIGETIMGPGTVVYHADPHYMEERKPLSEENLQV